MRVALDASAAARPERTGVGHYVAHLAEALLAEEPGLELILGVRLGRWRRRKHVLRIPSGTGPGADGARARLCWFWRSLSGVDVVHGPDDRLAGARGPQVVTIHDLFALKQGAGDDAHLREVRARRHAEVVAKASRILCVSEATARDVEALLHVPRERLVVTPLGVSPDHRPIDPALAAPTLARLGVRPPYVLFAGLAQPRKNLEGIARVFAGMAARMDDLSLVLAGADGYPEGRLQTILKETGALERVRQLGYVGRDDLPALYAGAACLLFPSRDEGFGLPALEAMACGCPVVASDRGALPEVVGPGGLLFAPDAIDDLEEAASRLIEDPEFRRGQVERGLAQAATFPWSRTARLTLDAYRAAIAAG